MSFGYWWRAHSARPRCILIGSPICLSSLKQVTFLLNALNHMISKRQYPCSSLQIRMQQYP